MYFPLSCQSCCQNKPVDGRELLDRRRLKTAHFKYAILVVAKWYQMDIEVFHPDLNETLQEFTPFYHKAFHQH